MLHLGKIKEEYHISRIRSYKQLYMETFRFLKAISKQDLHEAQSLTKNNVNSINLYSLVISIVEEKQQLERKLQKLQKQCSILRDQVEKLQTINTDLRSKINTKKESSGDKDISKGKLKIIELLENGNVPEVKELIVKFNLPKLQSVIQLLCQYTWIIHKLEKVPNSKQPFLKNKGCVFSQSRVHIQQTVDNHNHMKHHYNKIVEQILKSMLSPNNKSNFDFQQFTPQVNNILNAVYLQFQMYRKQISQVSDEEARIKQKLCKHFSQTNFLLQENSFYKMIELYIDKTEKKDMNTSMSDPGQTVKMMSEHEEAFLTSQMPNKSSHQRSKLAQREIEKITKKIHFLGFILKQSIQQPKKQQDVSYQLFIMNNVIALISDYQLEMVHKKAQRQIQALILKQEQQAVQLFKRLNQQIINKSLIPDLIQIKEENKINEVSTIFQKNFKAFMKEYRYRLQTSSSVQNYQQNARGIDPQNVKGIDRFIGDTTPTQSLKSTPQQQFPNLDLVQNNQNSLWLKRKQDLITIILEQRGTINLLQNSKLRRMENHNSMQSKMKDLERELRNTNMIRQSELDIGDCNQQTFDELRIKIGQLSEELEKKNVQLVQIKQNICRQIYEKTKSLEQELERMKRQYQETAQSLVQKATDLNKMLQQKKEQELHSLSKWNIAESKVKKVQVQKQKLLKLNEYLVIKNKKITQSIEEKTKKPEQTEIAVGPSFIQIEGSQGSIPLKLENQETKDQTSMQFTSSVVISNNSTVQSDLKIQLKDCAEEIQKLTSLVVNQQMIIENQKLLIQTATSKSIQLQEKCWKFKKELQQTFANSILMGPTNMQNQHLFVLGSIFNQRSVEERLFLIDTLVSFVGPIKHTYLLYRFDTFNKTSPHKYIDKHKNIVVIVKTIYGKYIAGFSKEMIDPAGSKNGFGLLISLWNRMAFEITSNKKPVTYDDFFIILGNSQLRIKSQQNKVFSNFGINNGYFNSRGYKVDLFLGEGTAREVNIESYEVYQLDLQRFN